MDANSPLLYPARTPAAEVYDQIVKDLQAAEASSNPVTGDANSDENWTLFRLPEIMLIYAEASNEVNGPTDKAYAQINAIRERAQLAPLSGLTKEDFRQQVWKERYHELAFEDKAYFDIQRTHMMYDLVNNVFVDAASKPNIQGVTFTTKYYIWPLPQMNWMQIRT